MAYRLAILHDPDNPEPPSNRTALQRFLQAAADQGVQAELVTRADAEPLSRFDALFIRDTTHLDNYALEISRSATAQGLAVIDDPDSILSGNDKILQTRLFQRHGIPMPRTMIVGRENLAAIIPAVGLPCVLKVRDGSFSVGVYRADNEATLLQQASALLEESPAIIAQEYLPTEFDWRIGVLDRQPLFACRYLMVPDHWQIIRREADGTLQEGETVALPVELAPEAAVRLALDAANLIGDGLYGVDIKQVGDCYYVIEVNDNPNVDAGNEDGVLQDELYRRIIAALVRRIEQRKT